MAQNVVIRGVEYNECPAVEIPLSSGQGVATFIDTSNATLNNATQMLDGVTAWSGGVLYTGSITTNSASDVTVSGATVTIPAGNYETQVSKSVANGTVTAPASISGTSASVSTGTNTLTLSKTISVTPNVSTAGYISQGTAGNSAVSLTASVATKAAATITPGTSDQEIAAGTYLTGKQTIKGDANLKAENIIYGKSIFNINGNVKVPIISQDSTTKILSIS